MVQRNRSGNCGELLGLCILSGLLFWIQKQFTNCNVHSIFSLVRACAGPGLSYVMHKSRRSNATDSAPFRPDSHENRVVHISCYSF